MALINDGQWTKITFANYPTVEFEEIEVTPPGIDGGSPIDTTTMENEEFMTQEPPVLKKLGDSKATVAYDPAVYDDILTMINEKQNITVTYPDDTTKVFEGWLGKFTPTAAKHGDRLVADIDVFAVGVKTGDIFSA